jgi:hypothetical protein
MLFIFGIRNVRIARYIDHDHICYPCKSYDREVQVYRSYFHFCFIPVFPVGRNKFEIRCRNCGDETNTESLIKKYGATTKTPLYLYSAWILFVSIAAFWFYWNKATQKNKIEMVGNPMTGDVYTIRQEKNDETTYYFLRIIQAKGDSILAIHNDLYYGGFVSRLAKDDYFVKDDTVIYKKKKLIEMLETDEIYSVSRNYAEDASFNRIQ